MGQKTNPNSLRLGIIRNWNSNWFSKNDYSKLLRQDCDLRDFLTQRLKTAGISKILIERLAKKIVVTLHSAFPGVIIGKKGNEIEKLRSDLVKLVGSDISLNIVEIRKSELDAKLAAQSVATQIEKRVGFRRAVKRAMQSALRSGALGVKVCCSGRLGGVEIARMEWYKDGQVPLHTLRADVDYGTATAFNTYGAIGIKVWIYRGEIFNSKAVFLPKRFGGNSKSEKQEGRGE